MNETKSAYGTICHRDGTVTYWDVHRQQWRRSSQLSDRAIATMSPKDRERVQRHAWGTSCRPVKGGD